MDRKPKGKSVRIENMEAFTIALPKENLNAKSLRLRRAGEEEQKFELGSYRQDGTIPQRIEKI